MLTEKKTSKNFIVIFTKNINDTYIQYYKNVVFRKDNLA